jgi:hypothetical protein
MMKEANMSETTNAPEEREEAQAISASQALEDAEALLRRRDRGVLCTLSARMQGWPFGSVVPYAVDRSGRSIILIAHIAEHTRNVKADARVSLLVQEAFDHDDVQARGRLTVMGRAELIPEPEVGDARARYLGRLPSASSYFETHDFSFYRIGVERLRYIGGFGKIFWIDKEEYCARVERDPILREGKRAIDHMNEDHEEAMRLWCQAFRGIEPSKVQMVAIDRWGTDLECWGPNLRVRIDFMEPATPETLRPMVVALTAEARQAVSNNGEKR